MSNGTSASNWVVTPSSYGTFSVSRKKAWLRLTPPAETLNPAAVSASPRPWRKSVCTVATRCS